MQFGRKARLVVEQRADEGRRALGVENVARGALQEQLFFGEAEIHKCAFEGEWTVPRGQRDLGMPSPRSLMMFFCTWDVPPPIIKPSVNMNSYGQTPSSITCALPRLSGA